jgi:hypothetical protein
MTNEWAPKGTNVNAIAESRTTGQLATVTHCEAF